MKAKQRLKQLHGNKKNAKQAEQGTLREFKYCNYSRSTDVVIHRGKNSKDSRRKPWQI